VLPVHSRQEHDSLVCLRGIGPINEPFDCFIANAGCMHAAVALLATGIVTKFAWLPNGPLAGPAAAAGAAAAAVRLQGQSKAPE
jgi:hypothetical protein